MTFNEYQKQARTTADYNMDYKIIYPVLGLNGEAGEVAEKVKKIIRDKNSEFNKTNNKDIALELSDTLWYLAILAEDLGYTLEEIATMNLAKLASRAKRNKIHGSGDNR